MTTVVPLVAAELIRAPVRTLLRVLALGLAAALLASMLLFIGHSLTTMTTGAVRSVPIDWQGPVSTYTAALRTAHGVAHQPDVAAAAAVATAPFAGIEANKGGGAVHAGAGAFLAVPPGYAASFHGYRLLRGAMRPGAVVLDQQLAATLRAEPGDKISIFPRRGTRPVRLSVSGIALVNAPDVLFQPLNPSVGPAPAQPPANVAIIPLHTFVTRIAPSLPAISSVAGVSVAPGEQRGTQWQVHAQLDPRALTGSPAHALRRATSLRGGVERALPGQVVFVDNLTSTLEGAATDALYAQALYIMLALPGALVGLALAYLASLGAAERDRHALVLFRARGARRRDLLALAGAESSVLGLAAAFAATIAALASLRLAHAGTSIDAARIASCFVICAVLATAGAFAARLAAGISAFRGTVTDAGAPSSARTPLWQRLYLDLIALAVSGLVYWLTAKTGFSAVVNPDSNPTLSLSVYMFLAPALLWIGGVLLLLRVRTMAARLASRKLRHLGRSQAGFLLTSIVRRNESINRNLLVLSLLLAFAVNLAIFASTYDQQAQVDARLTLGADVVAALPPGAVDDHALTEKVRRVAGVTGVSAVDHSYAYVGPDLQDIFGIHPSSLRQATSLRDSYFAGGTATAMLARLRATADGVLVSQETITDYSLKPGDLVRLRLLDHATGRFRITPFHVVGVVREFPSAPKDSFMVANLPYVSRAGADHGPNVLFVRTGDSAPATAARIRHVIGSYGAQVRDIKSQVAQTVSSITTVDLRGISRIEELFVLMLGAGTLALQLSVALAERRRELATMAALGAPPRRVLRFLWSEAAVVFSASVVVAAILGLLLATMLVAMLKHAFDPPPDHLSIPFVFLTALIAATALGGVAAGGVTAFRFRRMSLGAILREQ
jgi:putative ABC transport system permease protein